MAAIGVDVDQLGGEVRIDCGGAGKEIESYRAGNFEVFERRAVE
jgi:hypothetical protein